jgi:hypothetical protein
MNGPRCVPAHVLCERYQQTTNKVTSGGNRYQTNETDSAALRQYIPTRSPPSTRSTTKHCPVRVNRPNSSGGPLRPSVAEQSAER